MSFLDLRQPSLFFYLIGGRVFPRLTPTPSKTHASCPTFSFRAGWQFSLLDNAFLGVYTLELVLKLYVYRMRFWKSGWNITDFLIVLVSFAEFSQFVIASVADLNTRIFQVSTWCQGDGVGWRGGGTGDG